MNPIQYPHSIESFGYILQILVIIVFFAISFLIVFVMYSTPKLSKYVVLSTLYRVILILDHQQFSAIPLETYTFL